MERPGLVLTYEAEELRKDERRSRGALGATRGAQGGSQLHALLSASGSNRLCCVWGLPTGIARGPSVLSPPTAPSSSRLKGRGRVNGGCCDPTAVGLYEVAMGQGSLILLQPRGRFVAVGCQRRGISCGQRRDVGAQGWMWSPIRMKVEPCRAVCV